MNIPERTCFLAIFLMLFFFIGNSNADVTKLSEKNPVYIDKIERKIYLFTRLNQASENRENAHFGIVSEKGTMAKKALFIAFIDPIIFYKELTYLGLKPGNNLNEKTKGVLVDGSEINVSIIYEGKQYALSDIIHDTNGKGFEIKFGGNKDVQEKMKTGCIMCLESCYAGITSNARYPMISNIARFFKPNAYFKVKDSFKSDKGFIFVFQKAD